MTYFRGQQDGPERKVLVTSLMNLAQAYMGHEEEVENQLLPVVF